MDPEGVVLARGRQFEEDLVVVDLDVGRLGPGPGRGRRTLEEGIPVETMKVRSRSGGTRKRKAISFLVSRA